MHWYWLCAFKFYYFILKLKVSESNNLLQSWFWSQLTNWKTKYSYLLVFINRIQTDNIEIISLKFNRERDLSSSVLLTARFQCCKMEVLAEFDQTSLLFRSAYYLLSLVSSDLCIMRAAWMLSLLGPFECSQFAFAGTNLAQKLLRQLSSWKLFVCSVCQFYFFRCVNLNSRNTRSESLLLVDSSFMFDFVLDQWVDGNLSVIKLKLLTISGLSDMDHLLIVLWLVKVLYFKGSSTNLECRLKIETIFSTSSLNFAVTCFGFKLIYFQV